jgi:hypothetical protein
MTKSYSIASALLEIRKTSNYLPRFFADFVESAAVHKFNRGGKTILIYEDFSALQIDDDTKSVDSVDGVTSNLIEIIARLLQYKNNPADIPTYLWSDLREWLRQHG